MGEVSIARFSVAKDGTTTGPNDDCIRYNRSKGVYCISDGATISYESSRWAKELCKSYLTHSRIDDSWWATAKRAYEANFDFNELAWNQQAAYLRGSFATFAACKVSRKRQEIQVACIGDSLAVLFDQRSLLSSFAYQEVSQFAQNPLLVSTLQERNVSSLSEENLEACRTQWSLAGLSEPGFMLMTDALAAWLLGDVQEHLPALLSIENLAGFTEFVNALRQTKEIRVDDTSLLICRL